MLYVIIAIIILVILWFVMSYNKMISLHNQIKESWSDVDVQLKRRYDLIPNLLNTLKEYEKHESCTFEQITNLRATAMNAGNINDKVKAETALSLGLNKLIAVAENYPDLKASQNFLDFQKQLSQIEDQIQMARRYYNGASRNYNTKIQTFPNSIVAGTFHFLPQAYFQLDDAEQRKLPEVNFNVNK